MWHAPGKGNREISSKYHTNILSLIHLLLQNLTLQKIPNKWHDIFYDIGKVNKLEMYENKRKGKRFLKQIVTKWDSLSNQGVYI